jgi:hypothetical protein
MKEILVPVSLFALLYIGCSDSGNDKRRYEITSAGEGYSNNGQEGGWRFQATVLDTYTGKVWIFAGTNKKNPDSNWIYLGNPANVQK